MDSDPQLHVPQPVRNVSPAMKALWLEALERPEIDMQRMAAETIARAHERGIPGLIEAVPRLERILLAESSHSAARFAAARALIVLESRESDEKLFKASQAFGADLRQLVEPALAHWDSGPARPVWLKRLDEPDTRPRELLLAIRGLSGVGEPAALPRLLTLADDPLREPDTRLEAATAAGKIAESGLEAEAARLARSTRTPRFVNQLCAIRFLARHSGDNARRILIDLAEDPEPAVAAAALIRLNEIDSALAAPFAESAMKSHDQHVRLQGAVAYLRLPTADRIVPLSQLLADAHPRIRRDVCEGLLHLSENPELIESIRDAAMQVLTAERWQGQEQAALLLGALKHKPAANRLVELLESPRREVMVTAAWALRKVAADDTIPALIDKARRQTERRKHDVQPGLDEQVSHLFEALGVMKATDAKPLLVEYFAKQHFLGDRSRSAAIWAIGHLMEGARDTDLEDTLSERINDFDERDPERPLVKQMCAIALARMNAVDHAPMLREIAMTAPIPTQLGVALRWTVKALTGEDLPPPKLLPVAQDNWFLEPLP